MSLLQTRNARIVRKTRPSTRTRPRVTALEARLVLAAGQVTALTQPFIPINPSQNNSNNVLTFHNDQNRTGYDPNETSLTPQNVNSFTFGKLFSYPVDGYTYAQPLYVNGVTLPDGTTHNIVFVATEGDSLYAFDAANPTAGPNHDGVLWHDNFTDPTNGITTVPAPSDVNTTDIVPQIGITGTPVIDPSTGTIFVVPKTKEVRPGDPNPHYVQKLHALDITTGAEKFGGPVLMGDTTNVNGIYTNTTPISTPGTGADSVNGVVSFNALRADQRPGLVLDQSIPGRPDGVVFVTYSSHGDNNPYHGWVIGYDARTLQLYTVFDDDPNGTRGGIWQSGGAPSVDQNGNLILSTGNGTFDAIPAGPAQLGETGGALGYLGGGAVPGVGSANPNGAQESPGISNSVAVSFRAFPNSVSGLGTNGFSFNNSETSTAPVDFQANSGANPPHTYQATLAYDGTTLSETITDTATGAVFKKSYAVNIPQQVNSPTAWVGFTGGSGGSTAVQDVLSWTYSAGGKTAIDHSGGFATHSDLTANGVATFTTGGAAELTTGGSTQAGSIFDNTRVNVTNFTTTFTFQMRAGSSPIADGMTFTIQAAQPGFDYGESVLKLSPTPETMGVLDYFTPHEWMNLNNGDADLGSGAAMVLPDQVLPSGKVQHLAIETGKSAKIYLIDLDNMGKVTPGNPLILAGPDANLQTAMLGPVGVWGNPSFYPNPDGSAGGTLYYQGSGDVIKAFKIDVNQAGTSMEIVPTPISQGTQSIAFPGTQPLITSNNGANAIAWTIQVNNYGSQGPATLHAYDANNLANELYRSDLFLGQPSTRDLPGQSVKFVDPVIADGHVYVGTENALSVYGLFPTPTNVAANPGSVIATPLPSQDVPNGLGGQISLSWSNGNPNLANGIEVFRSSPTSPFSLITTVPGSATTYTDSGLATGTAYTYILVAENQLGLSPPSNPASATTRITPPHPSVADVCTTMIDLAWTPSGDAGYKVERSTDGTNFTTVFTTSDPTVLTFNDTGLTTGNYFYRVTAFATNGDVAASNPILATIGPINVNHGTTPGGFVNNGDLQANGSAQFAESVARLNNNFSQAGSVFTTQQTGIRGFTTQFEVRLHEGTQPNPADGFTFTLQTNSPSALGGGGGNLGYQGIGHSVAIKFDVFQNGGETSANSTGIYFNGAAPNGAANGVTIVDLDPAIVNLRSQSTKLITLTYSGTTLTESIQDESTGQTFTHNYTVNIPALLGSDTAFVGFTGGTGGLYSIQDILDWTYTEQEQGLPPRTPTNLAVTATPSTIDLSWKCDNAYTAQNFVLERSTNGTDFSPLATLPLSQTTFSDTGPFTPGTTYYYRVRSINAQGSSTPSNVVQWTIQPPAVNIAKDSFSATTDLQANGTTKFVTDTGGNSVARLTSGVGNEAGSLYFKGGQAGQPPDGRVNIAQFDTTFSFRLATAPGAMFPADGMTFVIQNDPRGLTAVGPAGGGLGYGPDSPTGTSGSSITNSVAIKFDTFPNTSDPNEGTSSTGIFTNGRSPTIRQTSLPAAPTPLIPDQSINTLPSGINLRSGDTFQVELRYDGTTLTESITDTQTGANFSTSYLVNITGIVGTNTAFVGFTGGTGGANDAAIQDITNWHYSTTGSTGGTGGITGGTGGAAPLVFIAPSDSSNAALQASGSTAAAPATPAADPVDTTSGSSPTVLMQLKKDKILSSLDETAAGLLT